MKCPVLFSEKNKKNISKCRLLKILPRVLSVKDFAKLIYIPFPAVPLTNGCKSITILRM